MASDTCDTSATGFKLKVSKSWLQDKWPTIVRYVIFSLIALGGVLAGIKHKVRVLDQHTIDIDCNETAIERLTVQERLDDQAFESHMKEDSIRYEYIKESLEEIKDRLP